MASSSKTKNRVPGRCDLPERCTKVRKDFFWEANGKFVKRCGVVGGEVVEVPSA